MLICSNVNLYYQLALEMDPDDLELSSNNTLFTRNFSESARLGFAAFQVRAMNIDIPIYLFCHCNRFHCNRLSVYCVCRGWFAVAT